MTWGHKQGKNAWRNTVMLQALLTARKKHMLLDREDLLQVQNDKCHTKN